MMRKICFLSFFRRFLRYPALSIFLFIILSVLLNSSEAWSYTRQYVLEYLSTLQDNDPNSTYWMEETTQDGVTIINIWMRPRNTPRYALRNDKVVFDGKTPTDEHGAFNCKIYGWFFTFTISYLYCDGTGGTEYTQNHSYYTCFFLPDNTESDNTICVHKPTDNPGDDYLVGPWPQTKEEAESICAEKCAIDNVLVKTFSPIDDCLDNDEDGYYAISPDCPDGDDCNDYDPTINPGAPEICDGKDNNCNVEIDEGLCCKDCCPTNTNLGSSANYASGNLFYTQNILSIRGIGLATYITLAYNSLDDYNGPLGKGWTHNYNMRISKTSNGSLLLMAEGGRRTYLRDDGSGTYRPDPGTGDYSAITIYNGKYQLTRRTGTKYSFDLLTGKLFEIRDRNDNTVSLTYTDGNLASITDPTGRISKLKYNTEGRIVKITDPIGRIIEIGYDADGYLSTITDPAGNSYQYTYDAEGRMLSKTDPEGNKTLYAYDGQGRIISSTNPSGTKTITYNSADTVIITERDGGQWTYRYNPTRTVPIEKTDPQGGKTIYTYDDYKNLIFETDPKGNITAYTYDNAGNMTSTTDPAGNTTSYTYNDYSQITSITDPSGGTTTYSYDGRGNLTALTDQSGAKTSYTYDDRGNIISITNPVGADTVFTYDEYNNMTSVTGPDGATTLFAYDQAGNMIRQTDPEGNVTKYEYNELNRLVKVTDPLGHVTSYTYDANGNRTYVKDANGNITHYEYNYKGQLLKVTDTLGNVTTYTYGGTGCPSCGGGGDRLTSITDAKGNTTTYEYDTLGRLVKETDPLDNTITYSYDAKGNLISKMYANGNTIHYTYDSLGRLTEKAYPDGTGEAYQYDPKGRITYAGNKDMAYTFTYDANGRVTSVTDSNGLTIQYEYDVMGNRTRMITPEGKVVSYKYDENNKINRIDSPAGAFGFEYDDAKRRIILTYPNGVRTTYEYDPSGRLTSLLTQNPELRTLNSYTYTHDKVGNRLTKTETEKQYKYNYDAIYRLLEAVSTKQKHKHKEHEEGHGNGHGNKAEYFTYDPLGNRLTGPKAEDYYFYNEGNQLTSDKKHQYEYDRNGNLIKKTEINDDEEQTTWSYHYDYENRLIKVIKQEEDEIRTITFKYDPFGRRIEKKVSFSHLEGEDRGEGETETYTYVYDKEDIILEYVSRIDGSDEEDHNHHGKEHHGKHKERRDERDIIRYIHGPGIDEPLAVEQKGKYYYYHADGLGSITALTDYRGRVIQEYEYDSFGNMKHRGNMIKQPYTFTGREWDEEIGLYYYRARYYDAEVGRFINEDPILQPVNGPLTCGNVSFFNLTTQTSLLPILLKSQKLNPYIYAVNNPVRFRDPLGLFETEDTCNSCEETDCIIACGCVGIGCSCSKVTNCKTTWLGFFIIANRDCNFVCYFSCDNFPPSPGPPAPA